MKQAAVELREGKAIVEYDTEKLDVNRLIDAANMSGRNDNPFSVSLY